MHTHTNDPQGLQKHIHLDVHYTYTCMDTHKHPPTHILHYIHAYVQISLAISNLNLFNPTKSKVTHH